MLIEIPDALEINEGLIGSKTDTHINSYLYEWQKKNGIEDGTTVCIVTQKTLKHLVMLAEVAGCA